MKKSVLFLLFLLSVQGLHAQYDQYLVQGTNNQWKYNGITFTLTEDENGKVLTIDGYNANGPDASFTNQTTGFLGKKFTENTLFKDAKTIIIKNIDTFGSNQTMFADGNIMSVEKLYIYTSVNNITEQAFVHLYIHDVYVVRDESNEKNGGCIPCGHQAFDYNVTVNETATSLTYLAKLHIPENDAEHDFYEHYIGAWKAKIGMLTQEALNVCKDGNEVIIRFNDENGNENTVTINNIVVANGWQEFASSDNENQIILSGSFIRTYSSDRPKKVPTLTINETVTDMFKAYRIKNYTYPINASNVGTINKQTELESVIQNHIIPANTGVILMSDFQMQKDIIVYLGNVSASEAASVTQFPYQNNTDDQETANLLFPSTYEGVTTNGVSVGPVDRDSDGKVTHRNFGLYYNSDDKYYHFSRYKPGTVPANKAYLKLTKDQFPNSNEDEYGIGANLARGMAKQASQSTSTDQIIIDLPESKYFNLEMIVVDNPLGVTTNIDKIDNKTNNDKYYNLQGMEVKNPAKGVFITNGKKIIVK